MATRTDSAFRKSPVSKRYWAILRASASAWSTDVATTHAAALAYYTVFSIAPLLLIALSVGGVFFGVDALQGEVVRALGDLIGTRGASAIEEMLQAAALQKGGPLAGILGAVVLFIGATTVFSQLQESLNAIWKVRPIPGGGIRSLLRKRLLSFAIILVIAFLMAVSLLLNAFLNSLDAYASAKLPGGTALWYALNTGISFAAVTILFAAIYKILPDVRLAWRDVRFGGLFSALFFTIGKAGIGLYLGKSAVASSYGAAGALIIIMLWTYYSSAILLFGAELTRIHAYANRSDIAPKAGAEWIDCEPPKPAIAA